jgi:hypothetical protein
MKTDGWMLVGGGAVVDMGGTGAALYFGSAYDTSISRWTANVLNGPAWMYFGLNTAPVAEA